MKHLKEFIGWFLFWLLIPIVIIYAIFVKWSQENQNKKVRKFTKQAITKFSKILRKLAHE